MTLNLIWFCGVSFFSLSLKENLGRNYKDPLNWVYFIDFRNVSEILKYGNLGGKKERKPHLKFDHILYLCFVFSEKVVQILTSVNGLVLQLLYRVLFGNSDKKYNKWILILSVLVDYISLHIRISGQSTLTDLNWAVVVRTFLLFEITRFHLPCFVV